MATIEKPRARPRPKSTPAARSKPKTSTPKAKTKAKTPIREPRIVIQDSGDPGFVSNLLIGIPTKGTVRMEWAMAFRGMMIPPNFSSVTFTQGLNAYIPVRYTVADAQNLIVKMAVEQDFQWVLFLEDDTIPPADLLIKLNRYTREGPPVVSGLYFTKSEPCEPLIYRGRGTGSHQDWKPGQKVWCDGVPTGCLLVHVPILAAMYQDAEEYIGTAGQPARRVFHTPTETWVDPETGYCNTVTGTSDLDWCTRVIEGGYLAKAGWGGFARRKWPFLVDTSIVCRHIDPAGQLFPM